MDAQSFDVFISYAQEDGAWSRRLQEALEARHWRVFLAERSIEIGATWPPLLDVALKSSRHMICLWSHWARASRWVKKELAAFQSRLLRSKTGHGSLMQVLLDDTPAPETRVQFLSSDELKRVYREGACDTTHPVWDELVGRLDERLKQDKEVIVIPVIPLTLNALQFAALASSDLEEIGGLGVPVGQLATRYGNRQADWQPFGDGRTLREVFDGIRVSLDQQLMRSESKVVQWDFADDELWGDADSVAASDFIRRTKDRSRGLIVVDPIAVFHNSGPLRLNLFLARLNHNWVDFAVLAPTPADEPAIKFRQLLRKKMPMLRDYLVPLHEDEKTVNWSVSLPAAHSDELTRLLGQRLARPQANGAVRRRSPILDHAGR